MNTTPRTENVAVVLDTVRRTGKSAFPAPGHSVSEVVMIVAVSLNLNPVDLQAEVSRYADEQGR